MTLKTILLTSAFVFGIVGMALIAHAQEDANVISVIEAPTPDAAATPAPIANETTVPAATTPMPAAPASPDALVPSGPAGATNLTANGTVVATLPPAEGATAPMTPIEKEISEQLSFQKPTVNVNFMPSLFYSVWEHDLVIDARRGLTTRNPITEDGIAQTGPRDIALAGIVYVNKKDWVIWLNDMRVSPMAIPDEVMDLKVFKNYIELEWFDESTNQIYPIRLRAHQRFNLDSRIFLPG